MKITTPTLISYYLIYNFEYHTLTKTLSSVQKGDIMIDITQIIRQNNYRLTLIDVELFYGQNGIILMGISEMKIGDTVSLRCRVAWELSDSIAAQKAGSWLSATHIKDGGFGFPERVDVIFDDDGFVFDIEGEPHRFTQTRICSICNDNPCCCTTGDGLEVRDY